MRRLVSSWILTSARVESHTQNSFTPVQNTSLNHKNKAGLKFVTLYSQPQKKLSEKRVIALAIMTLSLSFKGTSLLKSVKQHIYTKKNSFTAKHDQL